MAVRQTVLVFTTCHPSSEARPRSDYQELYVSEPRFFGSHPYAVTVTIIKGTFKLLHINSDSAPTTDIGIFNKCEAAINSSSITSANISLNSTYLLPNGAMSKQCLRDNTRYCNELSVPCTPCLVHRPSFALAGLCLCPSVLRCPEAIRTALQA